MFLGGWVGVRARLLPSLAGTLTAKMHKLLLVLLVGLLVTGMFSPKASTLKGSVTNESTTVAPTITTEITSKEVPPVPAPSIPTKTVQVSYSQQDIIAYIYSFPWPANIATGIARCESGINPASRGDGGWSIGVFQINLPSHPQYTLAQLLDWHFNVQVAYQIYQGWGNFNAWSTFKNGCFRQWL